MHSTLAIPTQPIIPTQTNNGIHTVHVCHVYVQDTRNINFNALGTPGYPALRTGAVG